MKTVILKFGGSSVADNIKLNIVAKKVISFKEKAENVVVVVSAQGKTTDGLVKEAKELSAIPNEREMDMLLSTGEQITASKLSILLNRLGYPTISLTGWQAGIKTNSVHKNAKIEEIYVQKIEKELEKGKIVVVAGFQGIDENLEITTLGRGGSDTSAVALQVALNADKCYIFSDVDGIYSADPNITKISKRLDEISFEEMQEISDAGAKVLHNRCIKIGKQFNCDIIAKSTFTDKGGTKISQKIESSSVKSIVKQDNLIEITLKVEDMLNFYEIYNLLLNKNIILEQCTQNNSNELKFIIKKEEQMQVMELLENVCKQYKATYLQNEITKLTIVGYGITQDNIILKKAIDIIHNQGAEVKEISLTQSKIEIKLNNVTNDIVNKLHESLI